MKKIIKRLKQLDWVDKILIFQVLVFGAILVVYLFRKVCVSAYHRKCMADLCWDTCQNYVPLIKKVAGYYESAFIGYVLFFLYYFIIAALFIIASRYLFKWIFSKYKKSSTAKKILMIVLTVIYVLIFLILILLLYGYDGSACLVDNCVSLSLPGHLGYFFSLATATTFFLHGI